DYCYDSAGRLTDEATFGRRLSFQLDKASNRVSVTWPDTFYAQYSYDALNRMSTVGENGATSGAGLLATYTYDGVSRRTQIARGDVASPGVTTSAQYDNASRLFKLDQTFPSTLTANNQTLGFTFTPASQIATRAAGNSMYDWIAPPIATRSYTRNG